MKSKAKQNDKLITGMPSFKIESIIFLSIPFSMILEIKAGSL